jgi:hypothetical protein
MRYFLTVFGLVMWTAAILFFLTGQTSVQQIFAAILGVSGSVLVGCACIVCAVEDRIPKPKPQPAADVIA